MNEVFSKETFIDRCNAIGFGPAYGQMTRPEWGDGLLRLVPEPMRGGVIRYIAHGIIPGGFLTALLQNDLMAAVGKADATNQRCIVDWCTFLHNYAPQGCFGSPAAVRSWAERGGLIGIRAEQDEA